MPLASYKTAVDAPAGRLWDLMLDKVERPDRYVPGIERIEILQRFDNGDIERRLCVGEGDAAKSIHEVVHADPRTKTVIYKLVDDPVFSGFVTNTVFDEDGRVELDFTMHWMAKGGPEPAGGPDWHELVRAAVLQVKSIAEEAAS